MLSRVLVAEADPQYQLLYRKFFDCRTIAAEYTTCGKDCVAKLQRDRFDLVILDRAIPCGGGQAVLKQLDALPADIRPNVLVIGDRLQKPFDGNGLEGEICLVLVEREPETAYFFA